MRAVKQRIWILVRELNNTGLDFTIDTYIRLLEIFQEKEASFFSFREFLTSSPERAIVLRHDVDKLPENSLRFAKIQNKLGITGSYYFRIVSCSYDEKIIKEIYNLGHEIGYHYEDLTLENGDVDKAYSSFRNNLDKMRTICPVSTICMHGSPRSQFDSRDLWSKYNYKELEIIGEPYFDVNFDEVFYLTDTGRRWDGWKVSIRDKVPQQDDWIRKGLVFSKTDDIIEVVKSGKFPDRTMFTFHPQRWTNGYVAWSKELITQSIKNIIKRVIIK